MRLCWLPVTKREGTGRDGANDEPPPSRSFSLYLHLVSKPNLFFCFCFFSDFSLLSQFFFLPAFVLFTHLSESIRPWSPFFLSLALSVTYKYSMSHCSWEGLFGTDGILHWYSNNSPSGDKAGHCLSSLLCKLLIPIFSLHSARVK